MIDLMLHGLLTVSACAALAFAIARVRGRMLPEHAAFRNQFTLLSFLIIAVKVGYVVSFALLRPHDVFSPDSYRYFAEIQQIAIAPWEWNPILGTGPDYQATPKLGMSYIYGLILFLHGAKASVYAVLLFNVVVSYLTCAVVFLLTLRLSRSASPAAVAMFLTAVYPETLFWNAMVLRENITLLQVTILVYIAIRLIESRGLKYLMLLPIVAGLLLITRAQLTLLLPLILIYYAGMVILRARRGYALKSLPIVVLLSCLVLGGFGLVTQQIRATSGDRYFRMTEVGPPLSERFYENIGSVLSLSARQEHGSLGMLLMPFTAIVLLLFVAMLLRFRRIFVEQSASAGLMVFIVVMFIVALAIAGLPNIRYRSTVAPLELSLVSVACCYYWRVLKLPRIALFRFR